MHRVLLFICTLASTTAVSAAWFKGNLHTHTINSDGNAAPDYVARWYREHGYNFLVITDHEYITDVAPLNALYARDGQFLVIPGQEVTQHLGKARDPRDPINRPGGHLTAINLKRVVVPLGGTAGKTLGYAPPEMTMAETFARNLKEIKAAGGLAQINHPNWWWSVRPADLVDLPDNTLFEIWNGQLTINNLGGTDDEGNVAPSTEALWDQMLSRGTRIWGVADDDAHNYYHLDEERGTNPGQAWVVVRADELTADAITAALAKGEFYSSTGVMLEDYVATDHEIRLKVKALPLTSRFLTRFIGQNGKVLVEVPGTRPHYQIKGDEGYVRAVVTDSNGFRAWTQPVFLSTKPAVAGSGK